MHLEASDPHLHRRLPPSQRRPQRAWTKKGKKSHFGYKMHIGMDAGSGLIRGVEFTPANVADTEVADALIMGTKRRCTRTRRMSRASVMSVGGRRG